jgi:hypothetical protein
MLHLDHLEQQEKQVLREVLEAQEVLDRPD